MELYKDRFEGKGHRYSDDDSLLHEFEDSFEFTETDDQITAVEEGLRDLKSGKIMDRLLCGDVGYGKTEVALSLPKASKWLFFRPPPYLPNSISKQLKNAWSLSG